MNVIKLAEEAELNICMQQNDTTGLFLKALLAEPLQPVHDASSRRLFDKIKAAIKP